MDNKECKHGACCEEDCVICQDMKPNPMKELKEKIQRGLNIAESEDFGNTHAKEHAIVYFEDLISSEKKSYAREVIKSFEKFMFTGGAPDQGTLVEFMEIWRQKIDK